LNFLDRFSNSPKLSIFTKIPFLRDEFFHQGRQTDGQTQTDGRTDMTKLTVAFRNSAKRNQTHLTYLQFNRWCSEANKTAGCSGDLRIWSWCVL